jgi:hypothetical protein
VQSAECRVEMQSDPPNVAGRDGLTRANGSEEYPMAAWQSLCRPRKPAVGEPIAAGEGIQDSVRTVRTVHARPVQYGGDMI